MAEQKDLTQGNLTKTLLSFALPYVMANFLQALYGAADLIIVGKFCESSVVSAVAIGSNLLQMFNFFITGLTVSGTVLIGKAFGAKQYENILKIINTMTICFIIASIILSLLLVCFDAQLLYLLKTPKEAFSSGFSVFNIYEIELFKGTFDSFLKPYSNQSGEIIFSS